MASPVSAHDRDPAAPAADPVEIRACLPHQLVAMFDAEWDLTLERAKTAKNLTGVQSMLHKWRHLAYAELRDPGTFRRLQAKTDEILRTGTNPTAGSYTRMREQLEERLVRQT